jgi:tetratricopeptide (TPR) repeat protein
MDQGLFEEAREILETVLIAFGGHKRATELMERLEALEAGGAPAAEASEPAGPVSVPSVQPVTAEPEPESNAFDLAAELAGEISNLGGEEAAAPPSEDDFQYSVEEVFAEFKKGLEKVVKPEDVDTHYDLGIAYKEMGLLDDAVGEFTVARQGCVGTKREVDCLTMVGLLQGMKGDHAMAVATFKEGLATEHGTGEVGKALRFELATAYEALGEGGKALFHFQQVAALDPKYRDVSSHAGRLAASVAPEEDLISKPTPSRPSGPAAAAPPPPAAAAGAPKARKVGYV